MPTTRNAVAGSNTTIAYEYEDDFATLPGTPTWKVPGVDTRVTNKEGSHEAVKAFDPDSRETTEFIEQLFDGALSVEFILSNPDFLPLVIATGDGASPETFDGTFPTSSTWVIGDEVRDNEDVLLGVVCVSCEITTETPGEARVSLDFAYANQETNTGGVGTDGPTDQPTPSNPPLKSGDSASTLKVGGTAVEIIGTATLTIENNPDMLPDFGTNIPVDYSPKERAVDVSYTKVKQVSPAVDEKNDLYGGTTTVKGNTPDRDAVVIDFDNGTEGIEFTTGPAIANSLAEDGLGDPDSDVELSPDRLASRDRANSTPAIQAKATGY